MLLAGALACTAGPSDDVAPRPRARVEVEPRAATPERSRVAVQTEPAAALDPTGFAVLHAATPPTGWLLGDHAAADAMLVTLTWTWPDSLAALLIAAAPHVPVYVLREDEVDEREARAWLHAMLPAAVQARVELLPLTVESPWVRDYGPLQRREADGALRWLDPEYEDRPLDDSVPRRLGEHFGVPVSPLAWSVDGGAVASSGDGLCVATHGYWRAHGIGVRGARVEAELLPALGCEVLVLVPGLPEEPTGHIDLMLQFLRPDLVAVALADPELEPEVAQVLDEVVAGIEAAAAAREPGMRSLQVVRLPTTRDLDGELHAYVNGLRLPGAFLLPSFAASPRPAERRARAVLEAALPGVEIVRVPAAELTDLGGAVHCAAVGLVLPPK